MTSCNSRFCYEFSILPSPPSSSWLLIHTFAKLQFFHTQTPSKRNSSFKIVDILLNDFFWLRWMWWISSININISTCLHAHRHSRRRQSPTSFTNLQPWISKSVQPTILPSPLFNHWISWIQEWIFLTWIYVMTLFFFIIVFIELNHHDLCISLRNKKLKLF